MPDGMEQFVTLLQQFTKPSEQLKTQVKVLREELQKKDSLVATLKSSSPSASIISDCEQKLAKLQADIFKLQMKSQSKDSNGKLASELALQKLEKELAIFKTEKQHLERKLTDLEQEKRILDDNLKIGQSSLNKALERENVSSKALETSENEKKQGIESIRSLQAQIADLKAAQTASKTQHADNLAKIKAIEEMLRTSNSENDQLKSLNLKYKVAQLVLRKLRARSKEVEALRIQSEKEEALKKTSAGDSLQEQLKQEVEEARAASARAEADVLALGAAQAVAQREAQAFKVILEAKDSAQNAEIQQLKVKLAENTVTIAELERERDVGRADLAGLQTINSKQKGWIASKDKYFKKNAVVIQKTQEENNSLKVIKQRLLQENADQLKQVTALTAQVAEKDAKIGDLTQAQSLLQDRIEELTRENSGTEAAAVAAASKTQAQIDELTIQLSEVEVSLEKANSQINSISAEKQTLTATVERLNSSNRVLIEQNTAEKEETKKCNEEKGVVEAALAVAVAEKTKAQADVVSAQAIVASCTASKAEDMSKLNACTQELGTEKKTVSAQGATLLQIGSELTDIKTLNSSLKTLIDKQTAEIEQYTHEKNKNDADLESADKFFNTCNAQVARQTAEIKEFKESINTKTELIERLQEERRLSKFNFDIEIRALITEKEKLNASLKALELDGATKIKSIEGLQSKIKQDAEASRLLIEQALVANEIQTQHEQQIVDLKEEISKENLKVKSCDATLIEKNSQIGALQGQIDATRADKRDNVAAHEAEVASLQSRLALSGTENERLQREIAQNRETIKQLGIEHDASNVQIDKQIANLKAQIESAQTEFRACVDKGKNTTLQHTQELSKLTVQIQRLRDENDNIAKENTDQRTLRETTIRELQAADGSITVLKKKLTEFEKIQFELDETKRQVNAVNEQNERLVAQTEIFEDEIQRTIGDSDKSWQSRLQELKAYECKWLCKGAEYVEGINLKICQHLKIYSYTTKYDSQQDADRVNLQKSFLEPSLAKKTTQLYYNKDQIGLAAQMLPNLEEERWHIIEKEDYAAFLESSDFLDYFSSENINILLIPMGTSVGPYQNLVEPLPGEDNDYDIKQALGGGVQNSREQEHAFRYAHGVRTLALKVTEETHLIGEQLDQFYNNLRISIKNNESLINTQKELLEKYKEMYREIVHLKPEKPGGDLPGADNKIHRVENSQLFKIWKDRSELLSRYQMTISNLLSTVESAKSKKK
jgi:chromosome segregation ATPase